MIIINCTIAIAKVKYHENHKSSTRDKEANIFLNIIIIMIIIINHGI